MVKVNGRQMGFVWGGSGITLFLYAFHEPKCRTKDLVKRKSREIG